MGLLLLCTFSPRGSPSRATHQALSSVPPPFCGLAPARLPSAAHCHRPRPRKYKEAPWSSWAKIHEVPLHGHFSFRHKERGLLETANPRRMPHPATEIMESFGFWVYIYRTPPPSPVKGFFTLPDQEFDDKQAELSEYRTIY